MGSVLASIITDDKINKTNEITAANIQTKRIKKLLISHDLSKMTDYYTNSMSLTIHDLNNTIQTCILNVTIKTIVIHDLSNMIQACILNITIQTIIIHDLNNAHTDLHI